MEEKKEIIPAELEIVIKIKDKKDLSTFFMILDCGLKAMGLPAAGLVAKIQNQIFDQVKESKNETG